VRLDIRSIPCAAVIAVAVFGGSNAAAAPGDLDPTFGTGGLVTDTFGGSASNYGGAATVDSAGRIITAGESGGDFAVARYTAAGALDPSFGGGDGVATTGFGVDTRDSAVAVALDSIGRIVVAGSTGPDVSCDGDCDFGVARFTAGGAFDPSFGGGDGKVAIGIEPDTHDFVDDLALDGSGRIVVAGTAVSADESNSAFAIVRLDDAGVLDSTFDGDGKVVGSFNGSMAGLAFDGTGRLVIAGYAQGDIAVARYTGTGSPDSSFDGDGVVKTVASPGTFSPFDVSLDSIGRIVVIGRAHSGGDTAPLLLRYTPSGTLDPSFGGGDGMMIDDLTTIGLQGMIIDGSGRIVVVGYSQPVGSESDFAVLRYMPSGFRDSGFGDGDGVVTTNFGGNTYSAAGGVVVDGADRLVVAGNTEAGSTSSFAIARYIGADAASSPPATPQISPPPSALPDTVSLPTTRPKKPLRCRRGYRKQKVRGKPKCIKVKRRSRHRHGRP
jgi:uncharacterized delta-60 repeat protein